MKRGREEGPPYSHIEYYTSSTVYQLGRDTVRTYLLMYSTYQLQTELVYST